MLDWFLDPFRFAFMQRALAAGILVALTTSLVGTWVVLRGLSFMGDALAHGVVPGIAVAFLLDVDPLLGAVVAAVVMIGAIAVIHRTTRLGEDTAIGLLFVGMLALGIIVISRSGSFAVNVVAILFGDVLGTTAGDLWLGAGTALTVALLAAVFYRPLLVLAFDEQKAALLGLAPRGTHLVMLAMVTLAVVTSFRTVGALLVFGLLVAPPATASLLTRRVPAMIAVSALIGVLSVAFGLLLSFHLDTAGGATMSFLAVAVFFLVLVVRELAGRIRALRPAAG